MRSKADLGRILAGLVIFSVSFGYVEAAVVVYLRSIYEPLRLHFYPGTSGELFPLLSLEQLRLLGPEHIVRLKIELGRELATLLMLAGVTVLAARKARERVAVFLVCFGIWDISFYVCLRLLLHWPASLMTWDILFLIPVPWSGPVIAPVLTSLSMIGGGLVVLWCEHNGAPVHITGVRWALILAGGALVIAAFVWDFRNTASGRNPNPFNWALFVGGEAIGLLAFVSSVWRRKEQKQSTEARSVSDG